LPERQANAEASLYGIFAEALSFPNDELALALGSGFLSTVVDTLATQLSWAPGLPRPAAVPVNSTALEAEYIRLFDVPDRRPAPLYTGVYAPRRRDAMEELLRIYRHFGLTVSASSHDLPDFVPTVLEFASFLSRGAEAGTASREACGRALADVLERHLCPWTAHTSARIAAREALPVYQWLIDTLQSLAGARLLDLRRTYPSNVGTGG
jgi:DMSO reductase family type II enzyme chaperone